MTTKTQATHTPGPWTIQIEKNGSASVMGNDEMSVAEEITSSTDARLIAAAPELLDACKFALSLLEDWRPTEATGPTPEEKELKAAILKAEGGSK